MGGGVDHKLQLRKTATENHIYSLPFTLHLCTHLCIVMLQIYLYMFLSFKVLIFDFSFEFFKVCFDIL